MKTHLAVLCGLAFLLLTTSAYSQIVEVHPIFTEKEGGICVEYGAGKNLIAGTTEAVPAGLELKIPNSVWMPVQFHAKTEHIGVTELGPEKVGTLTLRLRITQKTSSLVERTLEVTADAAEQFAVRWSLIVANDGTYETFSGEEKSPVICDSLGGGPEYPSVRGESIPVAMLRTSNTVVGLLADSPGLWENRSLIELDPTARRLSVMCGDGRDARELRVVNDARDAYVGTIDGWQSLVAGETRRFDTWVFASPALSHYDAQLAAHLALANAKGWNSSALEAILRNTAFLNLRRNLLRGGQEAGRFIFISGIGYGWKQWVSDAFWQAVALNDPDKLAEALNSVFINRITYEDNAQYYLIWAALVKRAGREPNARLVREAFDFIRQHEQDGIFYPPPLPGAPKPKGWKTYMDLLEYDDDDAPVSNQGFHCGALLAARELGLPVTQEDIDRSIAGYRRMFYTQGGYFPTSLKQTEHVGQDTLYGAALTYAVFGKTILDDEQVQAHWQTSQRIATPYGLRVISLADGSLLPGHSGSYVFGGSWFLNDSANHLMAGLHGLPAIEADGVLTKRIAAELAHAPAFHESISTLTGLPHGHINYSWNSGYWWLREQFRRQRGETSPDAVAEEIDSQLGVVRDTQGLRLEPKLATLRPIK